MRPTSSLTRTLLVCALVLPVPLAARAGNLTLRVDGGAGAASFDGAVNLGGFTAEGDDLVATGTLSGAVTDAAGERLATADGQPVRLRVARGSLAATCDQLALRLGPQDVTVGTQSVRLEPIELEVPARAGGAPLRELLCGLEKALRAGPAATDLARSLDAVLRTLG
jgi:hypothetical protein